MQVTLPFVPPLKHSKRSLSYDPCVARLHRRALHVLHETDARAGKAAAKHTVGHQADAPCALPKGKRLLSRQTLETQARFASVTKNVVRNSCFPPTFPHPPRSFFLPSNSSLLISPRAYLWRKISSAESERDTLT